MKDHNFLAITFDLWNTLIVDTQRGGRNRAARRVDGTWAALNDDGRDFPKDHIEEVYLASQQRFEEIRKGGLDTGFQVQMDGFLDMIKGGLSESLSPGVKKRIESCHLNAYLEDPPAVMPGALEVLESLSARGYGLGLICNSGTTPGSLQRQFLTEQGIAGYFQVLTFSDEEELAKPSPEIFLKTLSALEAPPEASLHIGDRPETDILGAKGVGMKAVIIGPAPLDGTQAQPDARIHRLDELSGVIDRLEGQ